MVVSVAMLGAGSDPAGYYLARQANCPADYYLGAEPAGRWLGAGAAAAGLSGPLDPAGADRLRALLAGRWADGLTLVPELSRADPRGRLPARPLIEAIRRQAVQQAVPPTVLFGQGRDRAKFEALAARVDRSRRGRAPTVSPSWAAQLADAAGIDVPAVYRGDDGTDRYATAVKFADRRVDVRRPGIDVTISAPKSVSVLFGLGDRTVAAAVRDAHQAAVVEALGYLESVAGHGLRGHQGDGQRANRIATDGWIVAGFEHHTSRAGDPQLHTHLVVPNLLHGADGKWSAVDAKQIYRHALTASYLYHASLRAQLTARLGVDWTAPTKGVAEIDGIPADLLGTFSTRRRQIVAAMTAAGTTGPDAAQAACLATRPAKPGSEPEGSRRDRWTAIARAAGHHPGRLIAAALGRRRPPPAPSLKQLATYLLGPAGLTAQATGFDRRDLLQALCQALPAGTSTDRAALEAIADQVLASRDVVRLVSAPEDGPRWTTTELLRVEQAALHIAEELRARPDRDVASEVLQDAVAGRKLSGEQESMVRALTAAEGLAVVVGPAGAGKTAALAAAAQAWRRRAGRSPAPPSPRSPPAASSTPPASPPPP